VEDERRPGDGDARPRKLVGVYDRPRVRRSSRILIWVSVVVVAIVLVLMILLK
jgi:hypothetical protein